MENKELDYQNPYGMWKVETEGDAEGRSMTQLGVYTGFIDEIALALADKCSYTLYFQLVKPKELDLTPKKKSVAIRLSYASGLQNINDKYEKLNHLKNGLFKERDVCISLEGFGDFTIYTNKKALDEELEEKRNEILSRLTEEEKIILGLE